MSILSDSESSLGVRKDAGRVEGPRRVPRMESRPTMRRPVIVIEEEYAPGSFIWVAMDRHPWVLKLLISAVSRRLFQVLGPAFRNRMGSRRKKHRKIDLREIQIQGDRKSTN